MKSHYTVIKFFELRTAMPLQVMNYLKPCPQLLAVTQPEGEDPFIYVPDCQGDLGGRRSEDAPATGVSQPEVRRGGGGGGVSQEGACDGGADDDSWCYFRY